MSCRQSTPVLSNSFSCRAGGHSVRTRGTSCWPDTARTWRAQPTDRSSPTRNRAPSLNPLGSTAQPDSGSRRSFPEPGCRCHRGKVTSWTLQRGRSTQRDILRVQSRRRGSGSRTDTESPWGKSRHLEPGSRNRQGTASSPWSWILSGTGSPAIRA